MPSLPLRHVDDQTRIPTRNFFNCAARCSGTLGRGREDHLNGINVGRPPLRCAASLETRSGLTRIPFSSFGNIIAVKATVFEIRTVSKSEQHAAVGPGRLVTERRGPPLRRFP